MGCKCWKQQLSAKWYSSSFGLPCAGLTALAVVWIRLTVGRGWMLPENKSLHCSCLLMHCLLGAWFMLVARSRTISTKWILCQAACLTEIFTLFSNCFPPDWICSILMYWLLLSRWLVYFFFLLLTRQIVAYHDFPRNWLLSFSSSSKWAAGNWNEAALGLEENSSVSIKPLPSSSPVETGLFETAKISILINCTKSSMPGSS